jgi:valyl-tRNA synthetase
MPHLTEELWHALTGATDKEFLALQAWPVANTSSIDDLLEKNFADVIGLIRVVRNLRALQGMKPSERISRVGIVTESPGVKDILKGASNDLERLVKADNLLVFPEPPKFKSIVGIAGTSQVYNEVSESDVSALRGRLEKDLAKAEKEIQGLAGRLANPSFAGKAPPEVVAECRANLMEAEAQADLARKRLADLA